MHGRRPLQNRVTPFGDVVALAPDGTVIAAVGEAYTIVQGRS